MSVLDEDWAQLKQDLNANFDITMPDALNDALIDGVQNLADAKPILTNLVRVVSSLVLIDALNREEQTQLNLLTNRLATAKSGYETAHPEFDPNTWHTYTNEQLCSMVEPYDPGNPDHPGLSLLDNLTYVYTTLNGKVRDGNDKIRNVLKKIIDIEPLFIP